jgi:hypothetical protein
MFVDFNILNQLGSPSINSNTFANRPAAGQTGRLFVSTDTFEIYRDNGTSWDLIGGPGAGTITGTGTATQVAYFTGSQTIGSSANLFWDNTAGSLGINTATPGAELDVHGTGIMVQLNSTTATANSLLAFQRSGTGLWRIGDVYNGGTNYFELFNTVLSTTGLRMDGATNKTEFLAQENYTTGQAQGNLFTYNLTVPGGTTFTSPNAIHSVNSYLNLSLGGNITTPAGTRQGLEGNSRISFTGAGTLTMTQGSTVRAWSSLSSVYSFNGSAVGTITHLAGLRVCFPDNTGSAVNITNNSGLLINDQTAGTGTVTYTNRWGIYQEGASDLNYFNGNLLLGSTTNSGERLQVTGKALFTGAVTGVGNSSTYTVTASGALAASKRITSTLVAAANNDILVGLDINPTFTNGAFTGVANYGLRVNARSLFTPTLVTGAEAAFNITTAVNNSVAGTIYGFYNINTLTAANASSSLVTNANIINASTTIQSIIANQSVPNVSAGTTSTIQGYTVNGATTGTGTVSRYIGYNYVDVFKSGSGTVTRQNGINIGYLAAGGTANIGILLNDVSNTSANGNWGIYDQSGYNNYLAGKLFINTTTDAGFRLDVNGTARFSNTVDTTNLTITNTNGRVTFNNSITQGGVLCSNTSGLRLSGGPGGAGTNYSAISLFTGGDLSGGNITATGGTIQFVRVGESISGQQIAPTSGTLSVTGLNISLGINTTGTYSGIIRGLLFSPIIVSSTGADIRAIETVVGNTLLGTTSGSTSIGATTTINASAQLQVVSTTKGFLPPVMTGAQAEAIGTPAAGLMVYANNGNGVTITTTGWWGYDGATWVKLN